MFSWSPNGAELGEATRLLVSTVAAERAATPMLVTRQRQLENSCRCVICSAMDRK